MAGLVPAIQEIAHPRAGLAERDARNKAGVIRMFEFS